jgi:hypothetical protein
MADDVKDVINKVNPSIRAQQAEEKVDGNRKIVMIKTGVKAEQFTEEAQQLLGTALEFAGGKDERKQYRVRAHVGRDTDGSAVIVISTPKDFTFDAIKLAEELQYPDTKRALQSLKGAGQEEARRDGVDPVKDAVQNGKTTPAAPVKVGQVGQGSQAALKVGDKNEETIRGSANYKIMQDKDGKLTALVDLGYGNPQLLKSTDTVKQQITATMDGIDGKPPKRVTFDVGKDGALTEVRAPAPTPNGNEKGVELKR